MKKTSLLLLFISAFIKFSLAQKPMGKFTEANYYTGKSVKFSLWLKHTNRNEFIFPDSTYNFSPFSLVNIEYFPTETHGNVSRDSVVYELITYDVDSLINFRLPITLLKNKEKIYSNYSSVRIVKTIKSSDLVNPKLKSNTSYIDVPYDFNFPKLLNFVFIALFSTLVFIAIFGKLLLRQYLLLVFRLRQREFTQDFKKVSKNWSNPKNTSDALVLWKNQMEVINKKPFASMTTKEITESLKNEKLDDALREIDASIYGGAQSSHIPFAFNILLEICNENFKKRLVEMKNELRSKK